MGNGHVATLQNERYRTRRAVRELLEVLASTRPLVLVLDDLDWADSASVELLGTLLRRPPGAAVLIAMGVRRRQVPERLSAALERAQRSGALVHLELGALTQPESREFLGGDATGVDALTARELEVARLIVDRKTNPEIAQELFVSLKTVETHVRNMLFKLEVTSRVELARAVERAARDTPEA